MSDTTVVFATKKPRGRWSDLRRVLFASLTLAVLYIGIDELWLVGGEKLARRGWSYGDPARTYAKEAAEVAENSKSLESRLSAKHPRASFQMGFFYGLLSRTLGDIGESPSRRSLPGDLNRDMQALQALARFLGIGAVQPLPVHSANDFLHLADSFESDAGGVAARVERATSPRLRHLFMLGAHVGAELATLDSGDDLTPFPPFELVGKHGTLASIPEPLWRPLTRFSGEDPRTRRARYLEAEQALEAYLGPPP